MIEKVAAILTSGFTNASTFFFLFKKGMVEMSNILFKNLILRFRKGDMNAFTAIYEQYKKLILFYSSKVGDDDTIQELNIFLIELLYDIDISVFDNSSQNGIHRYIAVSLRNKYLKLAKNKSEYSKLCCELYENEFKCDLSEENLFIDEVLKNLSDRQRLIIIYKYVYNYTDAEIAFMLNITRQAVNRLKNRALSVLREYYTKDSD